LQELKAMSAEDAQSIVNTWNRDVERQIERLFNANRRGNRNYYYKNMEAWAEGRRSWKQPQIAITTAQQTRWVAQTRFRQMNGLRGQQYVFYGPPPVCAICIGLFAEGLVSEAFIQQNPTPVHPLCPHEWRPVAIQRISCDDIWVG
jgi:hypothetical protein